jgi:hypothetical protein
VEVAQTPPTRPASIVLMKYLPARSIAQPDATWTVDATATSEIEDLGVIHQIGGTPWSNRWLGVAIAIAVAIVGFGFVGHWTSEGPAPATPGPALADDTRSRSAEAPDGDLAPFVVTTPADGDTIHGGVVEISGFARRPIGTIHLAILLGDAVLGWTNLEVGEPGRVTTSIRVFAPSFGVPVVLRIASGASSHGPGVEMSIGLRLHAPAGIGIWRTVIGGPNESPSVLVEGFGPETTRDVVIGVSTAGGRVLVDEKASVGYEDGRPGAVGGDMIGLGSFTVRLGLDDPLPSVLIVSVTWRDANGSVNSVGQVIEESSQPRVPLRRRG